MIDEPLVHASGSSTKPNSSEDHSTSSAPRRERCVAQVAAAPRKSSTKSRLETASIEFGATPEKPSSRDRNDRSVAKVTPAISAQPQCHSGVEPRTASK